MCECTGLCWCRVRDPARERNVPARRPSLCTMARGNPSGFAPWVSAAWASAREAGAERGVVSGELWGCRCGVLALPGAAARGAAARGAAARLCSLLLPGLRGAAGLQTSRLGTKRCAAWLLLLGGRLGESSLNNASTVCYSNYA